MPKKIVTALSGTRYAGSGWVDASSLDGDAIRRFELSAAALAGTVVEIWASSDNTAAADYTGVPPSVGAKPPTPPGGRLVSTITGPATPLNINPDPAQPTSPAQSQANTVATESYYYNFIRISADTGAVNMILVGEYANGSGRGTPILQGGQALGTDMIIGPTDAFGFHLIVNAHEGFRQDAAGNTTVGTDQSGTDTVVQAGRSVTIEAQDGPLTLDSSAGDQSTVITCGAGQFNVTCSGINFATDTGMCIANTPTAADPSSKLDVLSTTLGARPWPSMTAAERDLIPSPALGLKAFITDDGFDEVYDGTGWRSLSPHTIAEFATNASTAADPAYVHRFMDPIIASTSTGVPATPIQGAPELLSRIAYSYVGNSLNAPGTVSIQVYVNGAPLAGAAVTGLSVASDSVTAAVFRLPVPKAIAAGAKVDVAFTGAAGLAHALTQLYVSLGG